MSDVTLRELPSAEPIRTVPRRGRVGRYALWQFRDYIVDRAFPTLISSVLIGYLFAAPMKSTFDREMASLPDKLIAKWGGVDAARVGMQSDFSQLFIQNVLGSLVFLGALLAMNGIVANDRKLGFYRFLFAKPVHPLHYYGQAFVLHTIGYMAVATLLLLLFGALLWPILTLPLLQTIAVMFVMYAGITFMLSAAARSDWLALVTFTVAAKVLWAKYGESSAPFARLIYLFPPLNRTSEVYSAVSMADSAPWPLLLWLGGYGMVCFVIGLVVLRYRRMAIV